MNPADLPHPYILEQRCNALAREIYGQDAFVSLSRAGRANGIPHWYAIVWSSDSRRTDCEARAMGADRRHVLVQIEALLKQQLRTTCAELYRQAAR